MTKPRLILHIGTHKTGSTAIQNWLATNQQQHQKLGIWYGATDRSHKPWVKQHLSLYRALGGSEEEFKREKQAILDDFAQSGCPTLILSAEGLSEARFHKMRRMQQFTEHFEITVICFFRRQDYFLESFWNENSKQALESRTLEQYAQFSYLLPRLKYDTVLDFWSEFAVVRAITYGENSAGNSVKSFADIAGMPCSATENEINISPSMNCAVAMNILTRRNIRFNPFLMKQLFLFDRKKHGLGRVLRKQILDEVRASNTRLTAEHGIEFGAALPEEGDDPITFPSFKSLLVAYFLGIPATIIWFIARLFRK